MRARVNTQVEIEGRSKFCSPRHPTAIVSDTLKEYLKECPEEEAIERNGGWLSSLQLRRVSLREWMLRYCTEREVEAVLAYSGFNHHPENVSAATFLSLWSTMFVEAW